LSEPKLDLPEVTVARVLLFLLAVVLWVICLPVYVAIWMWQWMRGKNPRIRLWMFTGS
jgi:hypothetical protein